jgi:hypothetical protein
LSSADWSTFNGKQAALVSGSNIKTVGGTSLLGSGDLGTIGVAYGGTGATSLTSGYLLKGNGTSAVSASVVYDNGTNVGIGTSSPQGKLDVQSRSSGAVTAGLILDNRVANSVNTGIDLRFYVNDGGDARYAAVRSVQSTSGNYADLRFLTSASDTPTERMRVAANGNVSIGTGTPNAPLDVLVGSNQRLLFTERGTSGGVIDCVNAANNAYQLLVLNSSVMAFQTGATERMRIDSSGNVGIGISSPGAVLQLNKASGAADLRFSVAGTLYGNIYASSSDMDIFAVTAIPLILGTNNTERMRIGSTGIVYVNTTSTPSFGTPKLVVDGAISGKGTVTINSSTATTIAEGAGLLLLIRNTTNGGTAVVSYENAQTPVIISTSGGTTFQTGTPSGSAQIQLTNKSGNLGIAALASGDRNNNVLSVTILQVF